MQTLRSGSRGPDVKRVQQALNRRMLLPNNPLTRPPMKRLVEDSIFGPKTEAMVREFQRINGIKVDGIAGPITLYLLFPYISFVGTFLGQGPIRGIPQQSPVFPGGMPRQLVVPDFGAMRSRFSRLSLLDPPGNGSAKAREPSGAKEKDDEAEREGFTFEVSVEPGFKREFKPWFVLKPEEKPEGAKSLIALTVEGTILRSRGWEVGGEFAFNRRLWPPRGESKWEWEGAITGKYTDLKWEGEFLSLGINPVAELKVKKGLHFALGAGLEGEAALALRKDVLELTVGGKVAWELDPHKGNLQVGEELTVALKLKWDVIRTIRRIRQMRR